MGCHLTLPKKVVCSSWYMHTQKFPGPNLAHVHREGAQGVRPTSLPGHLAGHVHRQAWGPRSMSSHICSDLSFKWGQMCAWA